MVEDAANLAQTTSRVFAGAASSADRWDEIRNALHSQFQGSFSALDAGRIRQFQNELEGLAYAASGSDILDSPSREYIVKRFIQGIAELLSESPDIVDHVRSLARIAMQGVGRDTSLPVPAASLRLGKSHDAETGLQINVDSYPPANPEVMQGESAVSAPRSVLLANMRMEFYGDRALATLTPGRLGLDTIVNWRPTLLAQRVIPPVDLLPAKIYGRDDILATLVELLYKPDGQCHALTGQSGAGKTTVALALAKRALEIGCNVWWIPGSADIVDACMIAVAGQLGADPVELAAARAGRRSLHDLVWRYLEKPAKPWLLIFDGVDSPSLMSELLGKGQGCGWIRPSRQGLVIVSSCLTNIIGAQRHTISHSIGPINRDDAVDFLQAAGIPTGSDRESNWENAVSRLSGTPFTLSLLSKYLAATVDAEAYADGSLPAYADELGKRLSEIESDQNSDPADEALRAIFKWLSTSGSLDVLLLLGLISYYAADIPIPVELLDRGILMESGILGAGPDQRNGEESTVYSVLHSLRTLGLVKIKGSSHDGLFSPQFVHVHPLISRRWRGLLAAQSTSQLSRVMIGAARILASATNRQSENEQGYADWYFMIPHLSALLGNLTDRSSADAIDWAIRAAADAVRYLVRTGAYQSATRIGRTAASLGSHLDEDSDARLEMETALAQALILRGSLGEARRILEGVLDVKQRTLGLEDPASLDTLEMIALLLHRQGRLSRAELAFRQVIKGRQRQEIRGAAQVQPLSDLAHVLRQRGKLGDAERVGRQVLRVQKLLNGPESQEFFESAIDLAITLRSLGNLAEAEAILRDVLKARERLLGPDHRETVDASVALAQVLQALGLLTEADTILRQAVQLRRLILGSEHRDTIDAEATQAQVLRDQGCLPDAESLLRHVLKVRRRLLGADHPEYLNAVLGLGVILHDSGHLDEAEAALRELISKCEPVVAPENPTLLSAYHNLAVVLQDKGMAEESEKHYRAVLATREWSLGSNHPETLSTLANLGSLLRLKGMLTESEHMLEQAKAAYSDLLGDRHPYTLTVKTNIGSVYVDSGRSKKAVQIYREVVAVQKEILGYSHPDTLLTRVNLAVALGECGDFASAEVLLKATIASYDNAFETVHPNLLTARYQLARVLERHGKLSAALVEYRDVASLMASALGQAHADTIAAQLGVSRVLLALGRLAESDEQYARAIQVATATSFQHSGLRRSSMGPLR